MQRFENLMVFDVLPERKVVFLQHNVNVEDTLQILEEKRISSAPVVNVQEGKFLGFVDMFDIITCVLGLFPETTGKDELTLEDVQNLHIAGEYFANTTVGRVLEATNVYEGFPISSHPVKNETLISKILELFWLGVHRLPVINSQNNIVNVLTQSDLLAFMAQNIHLIGADAHKTLSELNIGTSAPVTAKANEITSSVVLRLHHKRLSAVPIVDDEGKIIANFSISDLKGLTKKNFPDLKLTVKAFLEKRAEPEENFRSERSLYPLTVKSTSSLEDTIYKVVATNVHRLWIVDENNKPVGTVSITDLMRAFLKL